MVKFVTVKRMIAWLGVFLPLLAQAQLVRYSCDFTLSRSDFVDSIGIEWDRQQVYVPVVIDGKTYRFLFDTGAAQAVVYADTPIKGCTPAGLIRAHDAVGAVDTVQVVTLPPLSLGQLTLTGCRATVQRRPVKGRDIDGIIGFDLINGGLSAKIDVRQRLLILTDRKDYFSREQGFDSRYRLKYHVPYIEVCPYGKFKEPTLFDTGSRTFYAMNRQSFDVCAAKARSLIDTQVEGRSMGRHAIGHFGTEPLGEVVFLCLSQLQMGDVSFCGVHTLTTMGESYLGAPVLDYGTMIFIPRKKRIRFQPYGQQADVQVDNRQHEIAFVSEQGKPCVGLVWEQGEPYRLGFREGDIILRIDGFQVVNFTHFVVWPFEIGRNYRFLVRGRDGAEREIHWVRLPK